MGKALELTVVPLARNNVRETSEGESCEILFSILTIT